VDLMEADLLDVDEAVTVYQTEGDELQDALALLDSLSSRELARLVGKNRRTIDRIRAGAQPRAQLRSQLLSLARGEKTWTTKGPWPGPSSSATVRFSGAHSRNSAGRDRL
jgi:hypothetical protein